MIQLIKSEFKLYVVSRQYNVKNDRIWWCGLVFCTKDTLSVHIKQLYARQTNRLSQVTIQK